VLAEPIEVSPDRDGLGGCWYSADTPVQVHEVLPNGQRCIVLPNGTHITVGRDLLRRRGARGG
jgi:hypothetical protein